MCAQPTILPTSRMLRPVLRSAKIWYRCVWVSCRYSISASLRSVKLNRIPALALFAPPMSQSAALILWNQGYQLYSQTTITRLELCPHHKRHFRWAFSACYSVENWPLRLSAWVQAQVPAIWNSVREFVMHACHPSIELTLLNGLKNCWFKKATFLQFSQITLLSVAKQ